MKQILSLALLAGTVSLATADTPIRFANNPALSPDGATITFDWAGDIWVAPSTGGAAKPLTRNNSKDKQPRFSPDGKTIAFLSDREGAPLPFLMPANGGTPKQAAFHTAGYSALDWHADGKTLFVQATRDHFWRHGERFFLLNTANRQADELLFDDYGSDGTLSPDGKKILFTREGQAWWRKGYYGSGSAQIWMFDRESLKFYPLLRHERGCRSPIWKPDGKGFYYTGAQEGVFNLREYEIATGKDRKLTDFTSDHVVQPYLSRDGSTLVFRSLADLYCLKPGNGKPVKISLTVQTDYTPLKEEKRVLTSATDVAFSQDGLEMAFISGGDLWVMDTELKEPKQVTATPDEERDPIWLPDGEGILFFRDGGKTTDLFRATRKNKSKFWWLNDSFAIDQITKDGEAKNNLSLSPDGKLIGYSRLRGDFYVSAPNGDNPRKIISGWNEITYDWSPDSKWIVYAQYDSEFNRDIWVMPLDLTRPPYNLSRHPDNESNPVWSPDGKAIAFTSTRAGGDEVDIYYVWLKQEDDETLAREKRLQKAIEKIEKGRAKGKVFSKDGDGAEKKGSPLPKKEESSAVNIDWNNLHKRINRLSLPDSTESGLFWSPDSKRLAFIGTLKGDRATYAFDFPPEGSATPKQISSRTGSKAKWQKNGQVTWLSGGLPASFNPSTPTTSTPATPAVTTLPPGLQRRGGFSPADTSPDPSGYRFSANQKFDIGEKFAVGFDHCWAAMRDNFYDEKLGNSNWEAVRNKYRPLAREALDLETFTTVVQLMLGEINGSHLGFMTGSFAQRGPATPAPATETPSRTWTESTRHLGARFVESYKGPGWKIRDVVPGGPADRAKSKLNPGEIVLKIDGVALTPTMDPSLVLNGTADKEAQLTVQALDGKLREVTLLPMSYTLLRGLLYRHWLEHNQAMVEKLSGGKLGYLHISAMDMSSFYKFEEELYSQGAGKEGLVIDVRENGGGSTADHLLTALTQPVHAIAVPRGGVEGYPQDRKVYASWNKPIVVLCNQNSFSNAEIFSHAIKALNRGKLVGVPTAGGVISTGAKSIMDLGTLRMPFRGWYGSKDGEDMELHGAVPNVVLWPNPLELPAGIDRQLEKGVEVLKTDVELWKKQPRPVLRKATDRPENK